MLKKLIGSKLYNWWYIRKWLFVSPYNKNAEPRMTVTQIEFVLEWILQLRDRKRYWMADRLRDKIVVQGVYWHESKGECPTAGFAACTYWAGVRKKTLRFRAGDGWVDLLGRADGMAFFYEFGVKHDRDLDELQMNMQ